MVLSIVEPIPLSLSPDRAAGDNYQQAGLRYDVSIDGMPFLLAVSDQMPATRATKESNKAQFDASKEPGEQSLSQWWTRVQDTWHRGAGVQWYEPGSDELTQYRYGRSLGVDVWSKGQASLLHKMNLLRTVGPSEGAWCTSAVASGTDVVLAVENTTLTRLTASTVTTYTGGTGLTGAPAICGAKVVVGASGGLFIGDVTGNTVTSMLTSTGACTPWWVKSRIVAANTNKLYELTLASVSLPGTPLYTHPDSGWNWTSVAETPDAILAAGYSNGYSAVYAFVLTAGASGSSPTLGGASQVVELPPGEMIYSMRTYLGGFVAIGTSRGVRVGILGSSGKINLGPLTVETATPVRSITARDTYFFAAIENDMEGKSGCARIDLSQEIEQLRYAWAYDAQTHVTGAVRSVAFLGTSDRAVIAVDGSGIWLQSITQYEATGYLYTGKIRYATTIPKIFAFVQLRSSLTSSCAISLSSVDTEDGDETFAFRFSTGFSSENDVRLPSIEQARYSLELKVTLEASTDLLATPVLSSLCVKALPQPKVQREVVWPIQCFDFEKDRFGAQSGTIGGAWKRYSKLEEIEDTKTEVIARDLRTGESFSAWITRVEMVQTQPPSQGEPNWGGFARITLTRL